jgi:transcription elongation factor
MSSQVFITGEINVGTKIKIINGPYTGKTGKVNRIVADKCEIQLDDSRKVVVKKTDIQELPIESSPDYGFLETGYTPQVSPPYAPGSISPQYAPYSPAYVPNESPPYAPDSDSSIWRPNMTPEQSSPAAPSVLEVPKEPEDKKEEDKKEEDKEPSSSSDSGDKKVIDISSESSSDFTTSSGIKKIII